MSTKIIMVAEAADLSSTGVGALIACLSTVVLDINDNPVDEFRSSYRQWSATAQPFASKYGFGKEFKAVSKRVLAGDDLYGDDDDIVSLGKMIKKARAKIYEDTSISREEFKLIITGARCLVKDDEKAWDYFGKNISVLKNTRLTSVFLDEEDEPVQINGKGASDASKEMRLVYKRLTGQEPKYGYFISPLEIPKYRESNPKLWEEYSALAKQLNKETQRLVFRYVRNKQAQTVSVDEVSKYLDKQGLLHNMPRGFTGGMVDENMKFYTQDGKPLDKQPKGLVRMNPKYDPMTDNTFIMTVDAYGKTETGTPVGPARIRTTTMNANNKVKRHAAVSDFIEKEEKLRKKWISDLGRKGTKEQIMAAMVEIMYATSARIGGKGNASGGQATYGLTTLLVSHVKIKGTQLLFDYVGKKMAPQPAKYSLATPEGKKIGEIIKKLMADKQPTDLLFTFRDRPILRHSVNKYVKALGATMSAHGFRRVAGTKLAMQLLAKNPFAGKAKSGTVKEADVNRWFKNEMLKVGEALHHRNGEKVTGMTAIRSYIDPTVIENFYASLGLRVPSFVPIAKTSGE